MVSGLFFPGSERRLLARAVARRIGAVLAEDVVDETLNVVAHPRFTDRPGFFLAGRWFRALVRMVEVVPRLSYAELEVKLRKAVRDPKDAFVLAGAVAGRVEFLVSGDEDLRVLGEFEGVRIRGAKHVVEEADRRRQADA